MCVCVCVCVYIYIYIYIHTYIHTHTLYGGVCDTGFHALHIHQTEWKVFKRGWLIWSTFFWWCWKWGFVCMYVYLSLCVWSKCKQIQIIYIYMYLHNTLVKELMAAVHVIQSSSHELRKVKYNVNKQKLIHNALKFLSWCRSPHG